MPLKILALIGLFAIPLLPTFWAILDIPKRTFSSNRKKFIWFFVVSTLPLVGALVYILFVRRHTQPLEV